ncbi:hypothetical protein [Accumulibacter sp.]|uniref:hypothetical protein n=1 Tax=Accumulibacter sp. TaxID=2053492 RepID=UPI0025FA6896|nr:hypothetical protein [Accumulibacter sp.]MCM8626958.1 hypothetical protein [Accumulibacter sp.]
METIEGTSVSLSAVVPIQTIAKAASGPQTGAYEAVRLNAMKHGILSKLAVLAHEDHAEFADLLAALIEEHQPAGVTEGHLIEELATIIWRKRRVLLAEGARINDGLKSVLRSTTTLVPAAAPFQSELSGEHVDLPRLLNATAERIAELQQEAELDLAATRKAAAILAKGGPNAYEKARRALLPGSRDWWDVQVSEEEYPGTVEGLAEFIRESLEPLCVGMVQQVRHVAAIKAQTLGAGLQAHRLENLNRYETHLDRKFERTLAMLLKLKELRGG